MDGHLARQQVCIELIHIVGSNIDLPVVFLGVKSRKGKEVDFNIVFAQDEVISIVGKFLKLQLVHVIVLGKAFIAHR